MSVPAENSESSGRRSAERSSESDWTGRAMGLFAWEWGYTSLCGEEHHSIPDASPRGLGQLDRVEFLTHEEVGARIDQMFRK
jgi:hypothetical protein